MSINAVSHFKICVVFMSVEVQIQRNMLSSSLYFSKQLSEALLGFDFRHLVTRIYGYPFAYSTQPACTLTFNTSFHIPYLFYIQTLQCAIRGLTL
jgi:hypothetical protein